MSAQPTPPLTPEEYLAIERAAEYKSEYYQGRMYAMAGTSLRHALIVTNISGEFRVALRNSPCSVVTTDLRVLVSAAGLYTYPDVVVVCGEPKLTDSWMDTLTNPVILIEVLSPSTEAHDRGFKSAQYRKLESLQEYAFVWQEEPHVEIYRRGGDSTWRLSEAIGLEALCGFESVKCTLALSEIYAKIA
jgi:Uma2 family endonuclease